LFFEEFEKNANNGMQVNKWFQRRLTSIAISTRITANSAMRKDRSPTHGAAFQFSPACVP